MPTYASRDEVWEVLGDPTRRAIVQHLAAQPLAVVDIAARFPISRPAVSQHLRILKDTGLVNEEAVGRRRVYRLNAAAVSALRDQLDAFWNRTLAGFESAVEQATKEQP